MSAKLSGYGLEISGARIAPISRNLRATMRTRFPANCWSSVGSTANQVLNMVHLIDALHLGKPNVICIALVECGPRELLLVDSGPESVFDAVVDGIRKLGFQPTDVRQLLASHIHLDHTGGAWRWAKEFGTRIYANGRGVRHLVDPSRLIESAARIYGDKMDSLWGTTGKIPPELVIPVEDRAELNFGSRQFRVVYTPGHAQHHNAYWLESERTVFAGDVAGVRIRGGPVIPPFPPPDLHLESWKDSLGKIRALQPTSLHITHFGRIEDPGPTLDALEKRLVTWAEWMKQRLLEGKSETEIVPEFEKFTVQELLADGTGTEDLPTYEQADPASMSVAGLARYWRKYHPEEVP
jgi:glyoxylase-like metal-dependent hydrolase (beta-lactamase superfamily II)